MTPGQVLREQGGEPVRSADVQSQLEPQFTWLQTNLDILRLAIRYMMAQHFSTPDLYNQQGWPTAGCPEMDRGMEQAPGFGRRTQLPSEINELTTFEPLLVGGLPELSLVMSSSCLHSYLVNKTLYGLIFSPDRMHLATDTKLEFLHHNNYTHSNH